MFPPLSVDETLFCCQVTAYGGELRYTVSFEPYRRSLVVDGHPDVVIQGNNIFLEHYSQTKTAPRQCLHNTDGERCERCLPGFYGDPVRGGLDACKPCPCHGITSDTQFSSTCYLGSDGAPVCDSCLPGFTGRRCEREDKPAADSCGDPFLEEHIGSLLPVGCGAKPVFNFSWDKEIESYGSGNGNEDDEIDDPAKGTTAFPARTLMLTVPLSDSAILAETIKVDNVPVTSNRSAPRLPPRFTPSPEIRHSSFQHLLRIHLNAFNKRLSMLEGNTLDMKESIRSMEDQQSHLNTQLMELIAIHSLQDEDKKITELERSYADMDARLKRLEGRLEILIDGFTALAQELNKMKRSRHVSSWPQKKRFLPTLSTVIAVPLYSTPHSNKIT
ncbi:hypothetical protein GOODEAATRI_006797 [Goodea atripinnis]|uniref:Laminin EGF-like domain-containing protein n=1 Tax=Goodea atripinnis TaxID=208336 RepID=A0ABV0P2E4_9TELE